MIFLLIGLLHLVQGALGIVYGLTPVSSLAYFDKYLAIATNQALVGPVFVACAGVLAIVPMSGRLRWATLIPQQMVLFVTAVGAIVTMVAGQYADGYVPGGNPHAFIIRDQAVYIVLCGLHIWAMYREPL